MFDLELTDGVGDQEAGSDEESIEGDAYQVEVSRVLTLQLSLTDKLFRS